MSLPLDRTISRWLDTTPPPYTEGTTVRDYRLTLTRCAATIGCNEDVRSVSGEQWYATLLALWGTKSPSTWNRNRAAVRAFLQYLRDAGYTDTELPALCKARKVTIDRTKAVDEDEIDRLWAPGLPLRERTLWRLLYESASRAEAALSLDVPDVDLRKNRARAVIKGGDTAWVYFEKPGAKLLREYIGTRRSGPLFLTDGMPRDWRTRAPEDREPGGRRYRLSYNRAERILKETTGGWTLHRIRHSRLSHLSGQGVQTPVLMALSGHTSPTTLLRRYAIPTGAAVGRLFEQMDKQNGSSDA
jgi:integrase